MECIVTLGAIFFMSLSVFFLIRLNALEKKGREVDELKLQIAALWERLGEEGVPPISPPALATTPATVASLPATEAPPARAAELPSSLPALSPQTISQAVPQPIPAAATNPALVAGPMLVQAPVAQASKEAEDEPSLLERMPDSPLLRWFMGSHIVVRLGIIILFIGVAFLLKYAADQGWFSIELRLASAGALGLGLVFAGWRVRARRIYGLTLQGGGLGIAYLTTFAAFRLYELLPSTVAFALLVVIGMACGVLAVLNDAKALALPAIVGGFAAPFLVSTGQGSHVTLFSYFTLVNAAILLIAWYKSWRELNLVGFLFTFVLATLWGREFYQPEYFASVEPFLILFFLFYLAIGLLFAVRQPPQLVGLVDGPIVFATPVVVMVWQALLVRGMPYALAWSATIMGLIYGVLFVAQGRASINFATLRQCYLAIGTILVTLAVPLAFGAQITSAIWALAGLGMLWAGLWQKRRFYVAWGVLVQIAAAVFLSNYWATRSIQGSNGASEAIGWLALFDTLVIGGVIIALTAIISGYLTLQAARRQEFLLGKGHLHFISGAATLWGLLWWYGSGLYFIYLLSGRTYFYDWESLSAEAFFFVLTAVVGEWLGGRFQWHTIRLTSLLLWAAAVPLALLQVVVSGPLLAGWGWVVWPALLIVHYWMLYRLEDDHESASDKYSYAFLIPAYHVIGLWLLAAFALLELLEREFTWQSNTLWFYLSLFSVPWLLVVVVSAFGERVSWPTGKHYATYMKVGLAPFILALALWTAISNLTFDGDSTPFRYLPLLNEYAIAQLLIFAAFALWLVQLQSIAEKPASLKPLWIVGVVLFFLWFNGEIARIVHHYWHVPFEASALLRSSLLQAIYSILWTLLAMALMYSGTRLARRPLWLVGAALLGLTVVKLLLLDLSAADTLARIVSFIVVGLLMLLIGYFSPIPPSVRREEATTEI